MKALRTFILAAAALAALYRYYPPARLAAWTLAGRSPHCPLARAVESPGHQRRQVELKDSILAASKKLETDSEGYMLWETQLGRWWVPKGSEYVLPWNLAEQERKIYGKGFMRQGDIVLDCGANIGVFAREALDSGARIVVAIEPAPENIECLRRNFPAEIKDGRVIVYPKGVWDKDDWLTLHVDPTNSAADSFLIERQGTKALEKMPLTTIDQLVAELKLERVDFIKMDIEGAEPNALVGGRQTIARFKPRMALSVYHAPDHPVTVPEKARQAWPGYRIECGQCSETESGIRPDIFFFHP